ncbi:class I SAM-dependent methyltransferase [Roseomonas marmotae]|uniref:Class I SAM-dependent methyltransferase n=1 Tax=Roseomonas marmotae TaxID=2768161 RepID=A0ABS3K6G6_9PROT|nr:class I SAM-dependent methyltransferase [Roseomonas marmotae]MBO1073045.1 class I SAM-dependent methyltransferase [Roseomonas marmotae]QTI79309.1 class I SAM-dependent methyltransferase [Roseomonas marmotae]
MTDGYVGDIPYPPFFHREMVPAWMDAVLRGLGQPSPDFSGAFRWCELGCGAGLNALVVAACHPRAEILAFDIDATQIRQARAMAEAAGLRNIAFHQAGFRDLAAAPDGRFGSFDVIATHGVLSWVSAAQRQAMLAFIARALRPGGIAYAHYMTHPGLSAAAAAQPLLRRHAATLPGDSARKAQGALQFLSRLSEAGAGYFIAYPQERQRLQAALRQDARALAHELLPLHWQPFHVTHVMEQFAGAGCRYLGSATPTENIDAVCLPAATRPLLAGIADPALAETARDIARNQSFRRDLYGRGDQPLPPARHLQALGALGLAALPGAPRGGGLRFDTPIGPVQGEAALFGPLLQALARGPQSIGNLSRLPGAPAHPAQLNQAVQMLLWSGCAHPLMRALPDPAPAWALNRRLAAAGAAGWLVAPALGTALPATAAEMAAARVVLEHPSATGAVLAAAIPPALREEAARWERERRSAWVALGMLPG